MSDAADESSFPSLFSEEAVLLGMPDQEKDEVLASLIDVLVKSGGIPAAKRDAVLKAMIARESLGSTGIGGGIAIPHVKTDHVSQTIAAVGVTSTPIDFRAVDGEACDLFLVLLSPKDQADKHLQVLRWLSKLVRNSDFCRFMRSAGNPKDAAGLFLELSQ